MQKYILNCRKLIETAQGIIVGESDTADAGTLVVNGVEVSKIAVSEGAMVTLKEGSRFKEISLPQGTLIDDCIEPGAYICDGNGIFNPEYVKETYLSAEKDGVCCKKDPPLVQKESITAEVLVGIPLIAAKSMEVKNY